MGRPLGIGEDVNIRLLAVADRFGALVHLYILIGHILEVDHPVIQKVLLSFGNQEMCLRHKLRVKAYEALCMVHGFPACLIDRVHNHFI